MISVLLLETRKFLSSKFDMKDLGEVSFVLGIEIHQDRSKGVLGLSQKAYIEKILKKFCMQNVVPHLLLYSRTTDMGILNAPELI